MKIKIPGKISGSIKIFHIISDMRRGGRERQLANIVSNTNFKKYYTMIICFNSSQDSYIDEYNLQDHVVKLKNRSFFLRLKELNKLFKNCNPNIVFTWGNPETIYTLTVKLFHKFIFINGSIRHGIRSHKLSHLFRTILLHLSKYVVANSYAGLKANYLSRGFVLYNGVDNKFYKLPSDIYEKHRVLLNTTEDTLVLISVANLVPYKDYFTVLKVLRKLRNEGLDFHYLILGDGPLREEIKNYIKNHGLEKNTTIVGVVEDVYVYLKVSDIFIHSSKGEGCSNAILEAMTAGLPVIATDTGGTSEIVNPMFGRLFAYQDSKQLYTYLKEFVFDRKKLHKLGGHAKEEITLKYTTEKMMSNYYNILDSIYSSEFV
jgi:glycosyltransferase involved in cell wall biosynthesis